MKTPVLKPVATRLFRAAGGWLPFLLATLFALTAEARLNLVVTTPDLGAITREVTGEAADIAVLARPTEDPHFVDPKPSFIVKLNRADALIEGGAELEVGWLSALVAQTRNAAIAEGGPGRIRCNQGVPMLEVPAALDRAAGDIHPLGNPHYVIDPENACIVATNIAARLTTLDTANGGLYQANARRFSARLQTKLGEWKSRLAPFQGQTVAAYHNSWPYFARRFDLVMDLFLEPKPGIQPSPAHLADMIAKMKSRRVRVVIVDPYLQRKTAERVAAATGATVVDVTQFPGGVKGTEAGYEAMLQYLVDGLVRALGKEAAPTPNKTP